MQIDTICWECPKVRAWGEDSIDFQNNMVNFVNLSQGEDSVIWRFQDGDTSVLNSFSKFLTNGSHSYTLEAFNQCARDTAELVVILTGLVSTNSIEQKLNIYPNPNNGVLNVNSDIELGLIEIFDIQGKMVLSTSYSKNIDLNQLKSGHYSIVFSNDRNEKFKTLSIIKR